MKVCEEIVMVVVSTCLFCGTQTGCWTPSGVLTIGSPYPPTQWEKSGETITPPSSVVWMNRAIGVSVFSRKDSQPMCAVMGVAKDNRDECSIPKTGTLWMCMDNDCCLIEDRGMVWCVYPSKKNQTVGYVFGPVDEDVLVEALTFHVTCRLRDRQEAIAAGQVVYENSAEKPAEATSLEHRDGPSMGGVK